MLKQFSIAILFSISFCLNLNGQCDVRIHLASNSICLGDTIIIEAKGGCGIALFVDFNDSSLGNLQSNNTQYIGKACSESPDSSKYLWMGTVAGQSLIYTQLLNVASAGYSICFDMKYGEDGSSIPCDGPSTLLEAVHLQYSINAGVSWTDLQFWNPNGGHDANLINWQNYCVNIPLAAQTTSTIFRWVQLSTNPANSSCWGIDNILIQKYAPTIYHWSTGYYGSIHPPLAPINTTTYYVTATSSSYTSIDSVKVSVLPRPTGDFTISKPTCKNDTINFIYTGNGDSTASFQWSYKQASQSFGVNNKNSSAIWNNSGQYWVSLKVTTGGCTSFPSQKNLLVAPLISFYISTSSGCVPLEVSYTGNVEPANSKYFWNFTDGTSDTSANPVHIFQKAGDYGLSLIAITDSGCVDTLSFALLTKVYPLPIVDFTHTPEIIPWSNPIGNFLDKSTNANSFSWSFGDPNSASNYSNSQNPMHDFSAKGLYEIWLMATSAHGCIDSLMKIVRVADDSFFVPNVITPNNDGINDAFTISNLESLKYCKIKIYNRWGQLIYHSNDYKNDWKAWDIPDGVYYYYLNYESWFGQKEVKGFFHVLRKY